jgi:DNA-binding transcriptional MerR regulator
MKIGDAAAVLGVEAHVLRHWEAVGLLAPPRASSGHRSYDEQTLDRARLIRVLQRAGLSLSQIGQLGRTGNDDRLALVNDKRAEIRDRVALLCAADRFLAHLTDCQHPVIAECQECSAFVGSSPG